MDILKNGTVSIFTVLFGTVCTSKKMNSRARGPDAIQIYTKYLNERVKEKVPNQHVDFILRSKNNNLDFLTVEEKKEH